MGQVSRPIQFLLLAVLAFAALWFVALRPKAPSDSPAPSTPVTPVVKPAPTKSSLPGGLGPAVDKARDARTQSDAAAGKPGAVAPQAPAKPAAVTPAPAKPAAVTPAPAKPAAVASQPAPVPAKSLTAAKPATAAQPAKPTAAAAKPGPAPPRAAPARSAPAAQPGPRLDGPGPSPLKVARALVRHQAAVLLFYNPASSDDLAVRSEMAGVSSQGGRVATWSIPVRDLSRFSMLLTGVQILQTPSVVVITGTRPTIQLAGFTDRTEIDQVAASVLRRR
jgi:hypothetical protein